MRDWLNIIEGYCSTLVLWYYFLISHYHRLYGHYTVGLTHTPASPLADNRYSQFDIIVGAWLLGKHLKVPYATNNGKCPN